MLDGDQEMDVQVTIFCKICQKYRRYKLSEYFASIFMKSGLTLWCFKCSKYRIEFSNGKILEHYGGKMDEVSEEIQILPPYFMFERELFDLKLTDVKARIGQLNYAESLLLMKEGKKAR